MAELRPHYIDVDLKKNTQYNVPVVTQNDTATHFIIRVTDDGLSDPELLDSYQEITMTSQRPDGESFYLTGTRIPGTNEIEFHLGTDETAFSGSVLASLQFYLVEDASRYTSAQFRYDVKKDLTKNYTPTQREETLVEVVLRDGPVAIQEAKDAKIAVDGALVELEQDKTAAIERLDEVTEENKTIFRQPVATFAALSTTYPNPEHGTTVRVTSEAASYRYSDGTWIKTDEYNPTAIDEVAAHLADKASQTDFNANDYGADPLAEWTVNRDAFQAANDAATANGGGRVVAKAGLYEVKGIIQDENVAFDLSGVTLKNPDGLTPSVISARSFETVGSVAKDSNALVVTDVSRIREGSVLIVHHAGGMLDTHFTALESAVDSSTTTITLTQNNGRFPASGYMLVGNELIGYTSISGTTLNGVERGALGSTASTHEAGAFIGVARHLYTEVTGLDGNIATLSTPAVAGVNNVKVDIGILNPSIKGVKIDANKVTSGAASSVYGIAWNTARWGAMENVAVENGDMGGIFLGKGATENAVHDIRLHNCGVWESSSPKGSGLWLFQACQRNRISKITVTGKGWTGLYMDDRTSVASPYDAPNYDNYVTDFVFDLIRPAVGYPPAFVIVGSSRNKFINGYARGTVTGVEIDHGAQRLTADGSTGIARDNEIAGVHFDVLQPWILNSEGNRLHECTYTDRANSTPIVAPGNLVYAVTTTKGNSVEKLFEDIKFQNGNANAPAIAFVNSPNTGFYRDGTPPVRLSIEGQLKYSFFGTEFRLADGITIATGTGNGTKIGLTANQKIGFFGKTPIAQPNGIANLPVDATLQQVRDAQQLMLVTLRNLGLIASG